MVGLDYGLGFGLFLLVGCSTLHLPVGLRPHAQAQIVMSFSRLQHSMIVRAGDLREDASVATAVDSEYFIWSAAWKFGSTK